jgi:CheY-like chemotaxis protein
MRYVAEGSLGAPWGSARQAAMSVDEVGHRLILIVEDDPIVAMMLEDMLHLLDLSAIGPAGSVNAAFKLIDATPALDAAVLDCNLGREKVWPVAERLAQLNVPFLFSTGYGEAGIVAAFSGRPVLTKPFSVESLERALMPMLRALH